MFICIPMVFTIFSIQIVVAVLPISLYYCLYFLRLTLVLLLISLCTAVLPAKFSQGGSTKEHLIILSYCHRKVC